MNCISWVSFFVIFSIYSLCRDFAQRHGCKGEKAASHLKIDWVRWVIFDYQQPLLYRERSRLVCLLGTFTYLIRANQLMGLAEKQAKLRSKNNKKASAEGVIYEKPIRAGVEFSQYKFRHILVNSNLNFLVKTEKG